VEALKMMRRIVARHPAWQVLAVLIFTSQPVSAAVIANSIGEFSGVQGQDNWFYGFYNQGTVGGLPHGYTAGSFAQFDTFSTTWTSSDAQVGANNNDFLNLNANGGHPNGLDLGQDRLIWAVRRYVSEVSGLIDITFDLRKINVENPLGGGITGRIFIDGVEVDTRFIQNRDGAGVQATITRNVAVGSFIDFAIDPTSNNPPAGESAFSARADGSHFSAVISSPAAVPEPTSCVLFAAGLLLLARTSVRQRTRNLP
jgi:hypothetical protein